MQLRMAPLLLRLSRFIHAFLLFHSHISLRIWTLLYVPSDYPHRAPPPIVPSLRFPLNAMLVCRYCIWWSATLSYFPLHMIAYPQQIEWKGLFAMHKWQNLRTSSWREKKDVQPVAYAYVAYIVAIYGIEWQLCDANYKFSHVPAGDVLRSCP